MVRSYSQQMSRDIIAYPSARVGRFCCNLRQSVSRSVVLPLAVPDPFHYGVIELCFHSPDKVLLHPFIHLIDMNEVDGINGVR